MLLRESFIFWKSPSYSRSTSSWRFPEAMFSSIYDMSLIYPCRLSDVDLNILMRSPSSSSGIFDSSSFVFRFPFPICSAMSMTSFRGERDFLSIASAIRASIRTPAIAIAITIRVTFLTGARASLWSTTNTLDHDLSKPLIFTGEYTTKVFPFPSMERLPSFMMNSPFFEAFSTKSFSPADSYTVPTMEGSAEWAI